MTALLQLDNILSLRIYKHPLHSIVITTPTRREIMPVTQTTSTSDEKKTIKKKTNSKTTFWDSLLGILSDLTNATGPDLVNNPAEIPKLYK
jgi:hypothetical protein